MPEQFDNPYSASTQDKSPETRPLDVIIKDAISSALYDLHTCIPAKVTKVYDYGYVNVQPLLKRKFTNGSVVLLPEIQQVPIGIIRGGNYGISIPVAVGDTGSLFFSERSIDSWIVSGGEVDPNDPRKHDLSDAIFFPGLYPMSQPSGKDPVKFTIWNGSAEFRETSTGKFALTNGPDELFDISSSVAANLSSLASDIAAFATAAAIAVPALAASAGALAGQATAIAAAVTLLKGKLDNLKGG